MFISVPSSIGLPALAALVLGESAGLPIPGETALIVSGGLASEGHFPLWAVIAVAGFSAIIGDTIGYWIGRRGGRKLLLREGRFSAHRHAAVAKADRYFERYGLVTVFFARFVPGVRVVGAIAAGTTQMRFRNFAIANALGCFAWATTVASVAYAVGSEGALIMVVVGFAVAGIGLVSAWWGSRRSAAAPAGAEAALAGTEFASSAPAGYATATSADVAADALPTTDPADPLVALADEVGSRATPSAQAGPSAAAGKPPTLASSGKPSPAKPLPGKQSATAVALTACGHHLP